MTRVVKTSTSVGKRSCGPKQAWQSSEIVRETSLLVPGLAELEKNLVLGPELTLKCPEVSGKPSVSQPDAWRWHKGLVLHWIPVEQMSHRSPWKGHTRSWPKRTVAGELPGSQGKDL